MLTPTDSVVLLIDMQERLLKAMPDPSALVETTEKLLRGMRALGVPVLVNEQYPQGLGPTEAVLLENICQHTPLEKTTFSACRSGDLLNELGTMERNQLIVCGMETHVCVYQTALDLLEHGYGVECVTDAVASRRPSDRDIALRRMEWEGVRLTTVEMVLFELLETVEGEAFKTILDIVK